MDNEYKDRHLIRVSAIKMIKIEAKILQNLSNATSYTFTDFTQYLFEKNGSLVVVNTGKSAFFSHGFMYSHNWRISIDRKASIIHQELIEYYFAELIQHGILSCKKCQVKYICYYTKTFTPNILPPSIIEKQLSMSAH